MLEHKQIDVQLNYELKKQHIILIKTFFQKHLEHETYDSFQNVA
jgi:hypothetical protein